MHGEVGRTCIGRQFEELGSRFALGERSRSGTSTTSSLSRVGRARGKIARSTRRSRARRLGEALLDSVPKPIADDLEQAWVDEARRRAEELLRGEGKALDPDAELAVLRADLCRLHGE
jgi:hypothetical protein